MDTRLQAELEAALKDESLAKLEQMLRTAEVEKQKHSEWIGLLRQAIRRHPDYGA